MSKLNAYVPNVQVQPLGTTLAFVGNQADLQACNDWLFNMGAIGDAELIPLVGDNAYFTVSTKKVMAGLATHWHEDFIQALRDESPKGVFPGTRRQLTSQALDMSKTYAQSFIAKLPRTRSAVVTNQIVTETYAIGTGGIWPLA